MLFSFQKIGIIFPKDAFLFGKTSSSFFEEKSMEVTNFSVYAQKQADDPKEALSLRVKRELQNPEILNAIGEAFCYGTQEFRESKPHAAFWFLVLAA